MAKTKTNETSVVLNKEEAITKFDNFSSVEEMLAYAQILIDSGLLPNSITEPEQAITIMQYGRDLGVKDMIALNSIHVIQGRPTLSHTMLGTLLKRRGVEWIWDEDFVTIKDDKGNPETLADGTVNKRTTIHFYWKSKSLDRVMDATFSVTWAQMVIAGYTEKDNWQRLPKEMMRARCITYAARAYFPEVLGGFYTDVEIADTMDDDTIELVANEEGDLQVVNVNN